MLQVSRYIHLNPIEARLYKEPQYYEWSSYSYYVCNHVDGTTEIICDNEPLKYKVVSQRAIKKGVDTKEINSTMDAMINRIKITPKPLSDGLVAHV